MPQALPEEEGERPQQGPALISNKLEFFESLLSRLRLELRLLPSKNGQYKRL